MTEFTLKVTLENIKLCGECPCHDSEWDKCRAGDFDLMDAELGLFDNIRPDNCPLQPIVERKCETCKYYKERKEAYLPSGVGVCDSLRTPFEDAIHESFGCIYWEKKE